MSKIFLTSDTHYGHSKIIEYCKRPFSSVEEMNETLIANWNAVVKPQDHVYHLGDVTMLRGSVHGKEAFQTIQLCQRLNGHKRLILGNHDHFPVEVYFLAGFKKIYGMWGGFKGIQLSHAPLHPDSIGKNRE